MSYYVICVTSPDIYPEGNVFLITKSLFSDKEEAEKMCDQLNKAEMEVGIKYYVMEMEVI